MNFKVNTTPKILLDKVDTRWDDNTIYNTYNGPIQFMRDCIAQRDNDGLSEEALDLLDSGIKAYANIDKDTSYSSLYEDVAAKVKDKLLARGFTTAMLYSTVEFTSQNTGVMSKQRAMLGKRDCFFKNPSIADGGKLFHDIYINLSYSYTVTDRTIQSNSYALYAVTKALAKVIPIRVIVVNHVGTTPPTCYSYILKQFGQPINPEQFMFFTSESKRTFGWFTYYVIAEGMSTTTVGFPDGTVSIADFNLDELIDTLFIKLNKVNPALFKVV